jgi:hypothetical protein
MLTRRASRRILRGRSLCRNNFSAYTKGGDVLWSRLWDNPYHGETLALSGPIDNSQQSWMETTVTGAGTIKFWWKASSEQDGDYLEF